MGISDKMRGLASSAQDGVKSSTLSFLHFSLRLMTGALLGLVLGLVGQELMGYGTFALLFVVVVVLTLVMKFMSAWSMGKILIFDLFCILVAMLLRMYVLIAP